MFNPFAYTGPLWVMFEYHSSDHHHPQHPAFVYFDARAVLSSSTPQEIRQLLDAIQDEPRFAHVVASVAVRCGVSGSADFSGYAFELPRDSRLVDYLAPATRPHLETFGVDSDNSPAQEFLMELYGASWWLAKRAEQMTLVELALLVHPNIPRLNQP